MRTGETDRAGERVEELQLSLAEPIQTLAQTLDTFEFHLQAYTWMHKYLRLLVERELESFSICLHTHLHIDGHGGDPFPSHLFTSLATP